MRLPYLPVWNRELTRALQRRLGWTHRQLAVQLGRKPETLRNSLSKGNAISGDGALLLTELEVELFRKTGVTTLEWLGGRLPHDDLKVQRSGRGAPWVPWLHPKTPNDWIPERAVTD